ncbi:MAG: DUF1579 family protein [Acidobacteriaceae bacterium]|nr:DUF1579 family protein [Acidobacteriaceae bacterium]MBV9780287.1 DUF1579 family protein [Acidobacteriaceae bacterium]
MTLKHFAVVSASLLLSVSAYSQAERMPSPSPELKKLDYFAGTWKTQGQMKPNQFGPGGSFSSTDHWEWQKGNFFLVGHSEFKIASMGEGVELAVMGYDPAKKVFTYESFNSSGEHEVATGSFSGDTWTWNAGEQSSFKWRFIEKVLSPTSFSAKFEGTQDGTNWNTVFEATYTKQ